MINGNMIGIGSPPLKTVILTDENGVEFTGVVTESEVVFDVTPADVRINKTFAGDGGIQVGENTITYRTMTATRVIVPGQSFSIPLANYNQYDYTKFQCIIVLFSSDYSNSAETFGITINDSVFSTGTSEKLSNITKNSDKKSIDLNLINDSENIYTIRYFTYRDEVEE